MKKLLPELKAKLEKLRSIDSNLAVFGAEAHKYQLNPVLAKKTVEDFEKEHSIVLPEEYRDFILEMGDGGAGPYYGIYTLQDAYKENKWFQLGDLKKDFPLTEEWQNEDDEEDENAYPENLYDGCMMISHQGCGTWSFLIVSGPERGKVWNDFTTNDGGLLPTGYTFAEWYQNWLNDGIKSESINEAINLKNAGKQSEAKKLFQQLIEENIDADRAYYHLGLMAVDEKNLPQAIAYYKSAIEINPSYHQAFNNLGLLYSQQQQYDQAIIYLDTAHELVPGHVHPILNLASAYYQKHDFASALEYYKKADISALSPALQEEVRVSIGDCYLQTGVFDQAEKTYENVITQFNKKNITALNQLGFINLEIKHNPGKAEEWINKALSVNPDFKPAIQNKGLILKALGKYEAALTYLKRIPEIEPGNFEGFYNIACLYSAMNNEEKVMEFLQEALDLAPGIKNHVRQDPDFNNYKTKKWFKDLVN